MSNEAKKPDEFLSAVNKTLSEIQDLLHKSGYDNMEKDANEPEMPPPAAEGDMAPPPPTDAAAPAPTEPAPEMGEGDEPHTEGEPSDEGAAEAMEAQVKELSDQELDELMSLLMKEKETRTQTTEAPAPGAAPPPPEAPMAAEKSMKEDFLKLTKSMEAIAAQVKQIGEEVKSSKRAKATVTSRPAAMNMSEVQTLNKSDNTNTSISADKRLSKGETMDFLMTKVREGSQMVNREVIAEINLAKSQKDVNDFQDKLSKLGMVFPKI